MTPDAKPQLLQGLGYLVGEHMACALHLGLLKEIGLTHAWPWLCKDRGIATHNVTFELSVGCETH